MTGHHLLLRRLPSIGSRNFCSGVIRRHNRSEPARLCLQAQQELYDFLRPIERAEAQLYQHFDAHKIFYEGICKLLPVVENDPVMSALSVEFNWYLKGVFKDMWVLIPALYYEHPEKAHATYRGALSIPNYPRRQIKLDRRENEVRDD